MTEWDEALAATREHFLDRLEQRGFIKESDDHLSGVVEVHQTTYRVTVRLTNRFPFTPPSVYPVEDFPPSWHRELDGAMCLYPYAGRETLPWLDPDQFITMIHRWLTESTSGWTADSPDLDLQRYFRTALDDRLVLYEDIGPLLNRYVRLRRDSHTITVVGPGSIPAKAVTNRSRAFGYVADIGEPATPPADWDQLSDILDETLANTIAKAVRDKRVHYLLLRYQRQGYDAVLALEAHDTAKGIELRSLDSAATDQTTLTIRSGPDADLLRAKNVLVIGAGSIGSHLCDALSRAGVGRLTIRDADELRPGNLIRHLASVAYLGQPKATAVRSILHAQPYNTTLVTADPTYLTDPLEVPALLTNFDLAIDATADAATSPMLNAAARAFGNRVLNVCVKHEGHVVRVDIVPPYSGDPLPVTPSNATPTTPIFEAGCGDPVSLTPPYAVVEAAALAARHAVAMLMGTPISPAGDTRDYR